MFLKSQVSVEYMLVMGFVAVMTIPLIILYYDYVSGSNDEIVTSQLNQMATKIVDSAESVYSFGEPSQTALKVRIPAQVVGASLDNKEVVFNISIKGGGTTQVVQISYINFTGKLPVNQGIYTLTLRASGKN